MKRLIIYSIGFLFLTGCSANYEPRAIQPEVDVCDVCNMSIVHEHYATEVILENGDDLIFDDIGCMYEYMTETTDKIEISYVKDIESDDWVKSEEAFYVYDASAWTPMAYGVLSFKEEKDALAYIEKEGSGSQYTVNDLENHKWIVSNHE